MPSRRPTRSGNIAKQKLFVQELVKLCDRLDIGFSIVKVDQRTQVHFAAKDSEGFDIFGIASIAGLGVFQQKRLPDCVWKKQDRIGVPRNAQDT